MFPIRINGNDLNPSIEPALNASATNYILVQTQRSLSPAQREILVNMSLEFYDCICENTYLCGYQHHDLEVIRGEAFVVYVDVYRQEFKIDPHLKMETASLDNPINVVILFHDATKLVVENMRAEIMQKIKGDYKADDYKADDIQFFKRKAHLTVPSTCLDTLATIDEIRKIEKVGKIGLRNIQARLIMEVGIPQQPPPPPAQARLYQGDGQVIAIADTGLDTGDAANIHYAFGNRVRHIYHPLHDYSGHGTHVCGSAVGDGITENNLHVMGTAPQAQLVVQYMSGDLTELLARPYIDHSARVHSDSWGDDPPSGGQLGYTTKAEEIDRFIWNNKDMVVCWAAGNDAAYDEDTGTPHEGQIGSEAAAKNCITVGASENDRPDMPVTYAMWPLGEFPPQIGARRMAEDPFRVAAFSSRGPTMLDGNQRQRIKPDIVAPGTLVLSARSTHAVEVPRVFAEDDRWCFLSGTSMATPLVAGCAAVLREALLKTATAPSPALISAALIKALLINGADAMYGVTPNVHSGFGRVNLAKSLTAACGNQGTGLLEHEISDTNRRFSTEIQITANDATLKTTLVWSDPPENATIRNKLRLEVEDASGLKRYTRHLYNNIHQVEWENISSGRVIVRVGSLGHLDVSPQPFAVVWRVY